MMRLSSSAGIGAVVVAVTLALGGCEGCKKSDSSSEGPPAPPSGEPSGARPTAMVKESLPRCRAEGPRLVIPGGEVVTGDAVVAGDALLLGVVRREGARRIASVVRASLDLTSLTVLDVGATFGDDPPPSPRTRGAQAFVASFAPPKPRAGAGTDAGARATTRLLEISRVDGAKLVSEGTILQQADESLAYDIAWPVGTAGSPLVAWDEDAEPRAGASPADRGVVRVQVLGGGAKSRVASPETTDAEAPRVLARRGGYWLAWLARRPEPGEDAGPNGAAEGPGERRAHRWVELVALDEKGEATSPVRRVSPEKGHVASFDLASAGPDEQLVVIVQDEAAQAEGAGERIVRYAVDGERGTKTESEDLLDGGVGEALADLLVQGGDASLPRWIAFTDTDERAHLAPLGPTLRLSGSATLEPSLEGARIVALVAPDVAFAVGSASAGDAGGGRGELRRLVCR